MPHTRIPGAAALVAGTSFVSAPVTSNLRAIDPEC